VSGLLSHSPSEIVARLLIAKGQGVIAGDSGEWVIAIDNEPDSPDQAITVRMTTPILDGRIQFGGETQTHYGLQIRVRSRTHDAGWLKINSIQNTVDSQVNNTTISIADTTGTATSNYTVHSIDIRSGPLFIGYEEGRTKRLLFTLNVTVDITESL